MYIENFLHTYMKYHENRLKQLVYNDLYLCRKFFCNFISYIDLQAIEIQLDTARLDGEFWLDTMRILIKSSCFN